MSKRARRKFSFRIDDDRGRKVSDTLQGSDFTKYFIVGGAGFIGSHFTDRLLSDRRVSKVTLYDNFSSGREWHYEQHLCDPRLDVIRQDVASLPELTEAVRGHDVVIHLASNPDIARAATEPEIDFYQGTVLTNNVIEAMRRSGVQRLLYASGSGVYGDIGEIEAAEDFGPLIPVSTYGASKLAGEALIASYCFMFGLTARVFRFGNVVGPRQTHGVGYDFVRKLIRNPEELQIFGDGRQSKSYIHVQDVISAVLCANERETAPFRAFNVATGDYITVKEIADLAVEILGLNPAPKYVLSGGDRGWKGDVPIVRLNTDRIQSLGWRCERKCREALRDSISSLAGDSRICDA
jgi:UDP-glucose 4-epimerase